MASTKEIRGQIKAVQNTAKITKAMEMVAASKMRKAQKRVFDARSYAEGIRQVIANLMQAHPEYKHSFFTPRENVKRIGIILVTTDKGLCGGLNTNVLRLAVKSIRAQQAEVEVINIGRRGGAFMRRFGVTVSGSVENISDSPELSDVLGAADLAIERYIDGSYDEVHLMFSEFVNTMTQKPTVMQLLPCPVNEEPSHPGYWDYLYEPDSQIVLDGLLRRYIESLVYHGALENKACEQSARMVAMKSATDNAKGMVKDLQITYNKARQAAITQELAEIVAGGAAA
ncbi:MAG: F0F1 ATP synthase subunit gamma [Zetaproteobacteria bacterium CG12_big_fil_rev_8_21_14_0_65_55_1124]|nr:MAG: F0F1 ATP synthase subunit gamma [Zetaproteobacteria bacterium CG1_02_55_237]PIS18846.1 MAG: F0F1 ATP synthase subunit gamma [Zetaproteobacteria bacterium CG08_land_8_20_14_0_20_55_17]PIW42764.1 MAG: F0F1 ATP synthase subunit gamma [Zetaproteobacteria bacterium CG12_big_fil_rev_8_21_14_0_65_55_1124]PIY51791.1 MAG: F0F1 ATP synthase subunit gamma [Zetaproteobacteria bacterium CG_4_10_14_0_8_um_filter_55_43]PIZ40043.1 MAG: F0F1 ATP synthase subunit gamma [Zetaproteobacteria bacterium CG_4_